MYNGNGIFNILNRRINESQFIQYLLRRGIFKSGVNWSGFKNCKIIYYQQENHRSAGNYLYNKTNKSGHSVLSERTKRSIGSKRFYPIFLAVKTSMLIFRPSIIGQGSRMSTYCRFYGLYYRTPSSLVAAPS